MSIVNYDILNSIMPKLVRKTRRKSESILSYETVSKNEKDEYMLALEIKDGPYRGVTFSFKSFKVLNEVGDKDGMVPTKFETTIHTAPEGFNPDESFDYFCSEVLVAWLHYLSATNFNDILELDPRPGIH